MGQQVRSSAMYKKDCNTTHGRFFFFMLGSHLAMSRKLLRDYAAESYKVVYNFYFLNGPFLGLSSKEHHYVLQALQKGLSCTHRGQYDYWKHVSQFLKKILRSKHQHQGVWGHFSSKKQQKPAGDRLKRQVTAANVKMCDNIAEKVKCTCRFHQPILSQIFW